MIARIRELFYIRPQKVVYGMAKMYRSVLICFCFYACGGSSKHIAKSDFGREWPFTVDAGIVACVGKDYAIIFTANGKNYALNDAARESGKYIAVEEILRPDDNYPGQQVMMDISNIEFEGLKLCDH